MQEIINFFQRPPTDMERFLQEINGPKVVKDLQTKFGNGANQIDIQNIPANELKALTSSLYKKVLFLGGYYDNLGEDQKNKYYNYFHVAFKQLSNLCQEINRRNGLPDAQQIELQMLDGAVRTEIINTSNRFNNANEYLPKFVIDTLKQNIRGLPGNNPIALYQDSEGFTNYVSSQTRAFKKYMVDKRRSDLSLEAAAMSGLRFNRDAGDDQILKDQAKALAEAFTIPQDERPWFNRWIFKTDAQKLYDTIYKDMSAVCKQDNVNNINAIKALIQDKVRKAQVRTLFSIKDTDLYNKIIADPLQPNLEPWEKIQWQKKLMQNLENSFDNFDPFVAPHILISNIMSDGFGLLGKAFLFVTGLIPPLSIIFAPSAKDCFKDSFVEQVFNASDYITKPFRWCIEKLIIVPIEAPFKFCDAVREAVFESENFDPNISVFERIGSALNTKKFVESTIFHDEYDYQTEEPKITRMLTQIKTTIETNITTEKTVNLPQKDRQRNDVKFTAKVTAKDLADPQNRINNEKADIRGRL